MNISLLNRILSLTGWLRIVDYLKSFILLAVINCIFYQNVFSVLLLKQILTIEGKGCCEADIKTLKDLLKSKSFNVDEYKIYQPLFEYTVNVLNFCALKSGLDISETESNDYKVIYYKNLHRFFILLALATCRVEFLKKNIILCNYDCLEELITSYSKFFNFEYGDIDWWYFFKFINNDPIKVRGRSISEGRISDKIDFDQFCLVCDDFCLNIGKNELSNFLKNDYCLFFKNNYYLFLKSNNPFSQEDAIGFYNYKINNDYSVFGLSICPWKTL